MRATRCRRPSIPPRIPRRPLRLPPERRRCSSPHSSCPVIRCGSKGLGARLSVCASDPRTAGQLSGDQHVAGTLIVEFTLQANGTAANARVVQTSLPSEFGRLALSAVAHGHFDTRELTDGQPQKARLLLRFQSGDPGNHEPTTSGNVRRAGRRDQWLQWSATALFSAALAVLLVLGMGAARWFASGLLGPAVDGAALGKPELISAD